MKSDRRHELGTNKLAESLGRFVRRIRPFTRYVVIVLVVAAVIFFLQFREYRRREAASEREAVEFSRASRAQDTSLLEDFVERHKDAKQRPVAMLALANRLFRSAVVKGDDDEETPAEERLQKAEKLYRAVVEEYPSHAPLARYCLALVSAHRGNLESARRQLSDLSRAHYGELVGDLASSGKDRLGGLRPVEFAPQEAPPDDKDKREPEPAAGGATSAPEEKK